MKKVIIASVAILALSTPSAFAKHHKMMKKDAAATSTTAAPMMMGNDSAANMKMMKQNKHDSGMK